MAKELLVFCQYCGGRVGASANACSGCWAKVKAAAMPTFDTATGRSLYGGLPRSCDECGVSSYFVKGNCDQCGAKPTRSPASSVTEATADFHVFEFVIVGEPVGKPRYRKGDQSPRVKRYRDWAERARAAAGNLPAAEAVADLSWRAVLSPPKSKGGRKYTEAERQAMHGRPATRKPDRDNIDKALLDALFDDDAAICKGTISKVYGAVPRLEVVVTYERAGE